VLKQGRPIETSALLIALICGFIDLVVALAEYLQVMLFIRPWLWLHATLVRLLSLVSLALWRQGLELAPDRHMVSLIENGLSLGGADHRQILPETTRLEQYLVVNQTRLFFGV